MPASNLGKSIYTRSIPLVLFVCLVLSLANIFRLSAQTNSFRSGAREAALANSSVALSTDWPMFHNPAGLTRLKNTTLGVHYTNQYLMRELSTTSATGSMPVASGAFGFSLSYFGTTRYNQQKFAVGYAHQLGDFLSAGVTFDYFNTHLPEDYEASHALAGEIGLIANPIDKLSIGCHIYNLTGSKYSTYTAENVPSFFSLGVAWESDAFLVSAQVNSDKENEPTISFGSEVFLIESFAVRIGISTDEQFQYSFGFGYNNIRFKGDIAFTRHPVLGFSSYVSFNYSFAAKTK